MMKINKNNAYIFFEYLDELFLNARCELNYSKDYELVIAVMLSAQTTDAKVNKVTEELFSRFPSLYDISTCDFDEIEKLIRPLGLSKVKAKNVIGIAKSLIENYGGVFPLWLAPRQINIIPVNSEIHSEYAHTVEKQLKEAGFKVEVDDRNEKLGYRMREGQLAKIPVTLVVGDNEMNSNSVNVRRHGKEGQESISVNELIDVLKKEVEEKK